MLNLRDEVLVIMPSSHILKRAEKNRPTFSMKALRPLAAMCGDSARSASGRGDPLPRAGDGEGDAPWDETRTGGGSGDQDEPIRLPGTEPASRNLVQLTSFPGTGAGDRGQGQGQDQRGERAETSRLG